MVYVLTVGLGGVWGPGYSHYAETISTLTSRGAPDQAILVPPFAIYDLSVVALAAGLHRRVNPTRWGALGPSFLGAAGLALFLVPQGPWNDPLSGTGVAHTVVAGIDALCFLLAMGFLGRRLGADPVSAAHDRVTVVLLAAGIVLGGFGAASITTAYAGLAERASIGVFLVWPEVLAVRLAWSGRSVLPPAKRGAPAPG